MPNHLLHENSPYLLQHASNPVDWYPWGEEALTKARTEDKPIFLSIGYSACHWCHVMAHESFEHPPTAALMNKYFVNIKVDREERPDVDGIYMQAVMALTGRGGWPMSVFLTPEGFPFFGGTYFPPVRRYNMPAFDEILEAVARLWKEDRAKLAKSGEEITKLLLAQTTHDPIRFHFFEDVLAKAAQSLDKSYDWQYGGWGNAPKFPQPMIIEFLLRLSTRGDQKSKNIGMHALRAMAKGGMYDVIGGGFARYSTDDQWLVPHFEKMLYDNAQLALVYLHGWMVSGEARFREVCEDTLEFVMREMTHPQGGFYSSLDADSDGEEGKFYIWSYEDLQSVLQNAQELAFFCEAYHLPREGNFDGKIVLQRTKTDAELAEMFGESIDAINAHLHTIHKLLLVNRSERIRPTIDDKILVAWNALMMIAFAEAGRYLGRSGYLEVAQQNASFLLQNLFCEDRLLRTWRDGNAKHNAYLEDYAALILGLLAVYQSDGNPDWFQAARKLTKQMLDFFSDPEGGFYDTSLDHEKLLFRPKDVQDNATPSGSALAACALLLMGAYEGNNEWRRYAEAMLDQHAEMMERYPTAFAQWLQAGDFAIGPVFEIAIIGYTQDAAKDALYAELSNQYQPRQISAYSVYPPEQGSPALLKDRAPVNNQPTAYVCKEFACQMPVTTPKALRQQLDNLE